MNRTLGWALGVALALASAIPQAAAPQWTNIGRTGGWARIAADPASAEHAWAFGANGEAYETVDGGTTWRAAATKPCNRPTASPMIRDGVVYVFCLYGGIRSSRDGAAWTLLTDAVLRDAEELVVAPGAPNIAVSVASTTTTTLALHVTQDGGKTWQHLPGTSPALVMVFDPKAGPGRLVGARATADASNNQQVAVYESTTVGVGGWRQIGSIPVGGCAPQSMVVDAGGAFFLHASCGIYLSRDGGTNWTKVSEVPASSGRYLLADPSRPGKLWFYAQTALYESSDSFATKTQVWPRSGETLVNADVGADGSIWIAAYSDGGIYRRRPGGTWGNSLLGLRTYGDEVSAIIGANHDILITQYGSLSSDGGATWKQPAVTGYSTFTNGNYVPVPGYPMSVYAAIAAPNVSPDGSSTLMYSGDAGATWTTMAQRTADANGTSVGYLHPAGPQPGVIYGATVAAACSDGVTPCSPGKMVRSDDGGKTWKAIDSGLSGSGRLIRPSPTNPMLVYVATSTALFRSTDSGATWLRIRDGNTDDLIVDLRDGTTVYFVSGDKVTVSENYGNDWRDGALLDLKGVRILADQIDAGRAFAIGDDGSVFETRDRARSWRRVAVGAPFTLASDGVSLAPELPPQLGTRGGVRSIIANSAWSSWSLDVETPRFLLGTDLWFNPAQSGWGVSIAQHASGQMFVVWFTYDAQGHPTWRFIPGGTWTDSQTFAGDLYIARGPAWLGVPFSPSSVTITKVGRGSLHFGDENAGDVSFVLDDGTRFDSPFARMAFGPVAAPQPRVADLWFNPLESGWGITVHQQFGTLFACWFIYDDAGNPSWVLTPDARPVYAGAPTYVGDVFSAASLPAGAFNARNVTTTKVGTATFSVAYGRAKLEYTISGKSGTRLIERIPF